MGSPSPTSPMPLTNRDEAPELSSSMLASFIYDTSSITDRLIRAEANLYPSRLSFSSSDVTDIGSHTPTESVKDLPTGNGRSETAMVTPKASDELDGEKMGTGQDRSCGLHIPDTSSSAQVSTSPGSHQLERPWFLQTVPFILLTLFQQWTGLRPRTHDHSTETSQSSGQWQQSLGQQQGSDGGGKGKRRVQEEEEADKDKDTDDEDASHEPKRMKASQNPRGFACPFSKKDLPQYRSCAMFSQTDIKHVNQHVKRKHMKDMDEDSILRFEKGVTRRQSSEKQWYQIYDHLFPDGPKPRTPYNDFIILYEPPRSEDSREDVPWGEDLEILRERLTRDGADMLRQELSRAIAQVPTAPIVNKDVINGVADRTVTQLVNILSCRLQHLALGHSSQATSQHVAERGNTSTDQEPTFDEPGTQLSSLDDGPGEAVEFLGDQGVTMPLSFHPTPDQNSSWDAVEDVSNGNEGPDQKDFNFEPINEQLGGQDAQDGGDSLIPMIDEEIWDFDDYFFFDPEDLHNGDM